MKSILFVIPWRQSLENNPNYDYSKEAERAPENVVCLATFLEAHGVRVKIADMFKIVVDNKGNISQSLVELTKICNDFNPDYIGLSFFTARFLQASTIVNSLRSKYPKGEEVKIIAGGVHPTLLPELTMKHISFDALIIGEGEIPLLKLMRGEKMSLVKGVYTFPNYNKEKADIIMNLDDLPLPNWSLVDINFYNRPSYLISYEKPDGVMPITFGRGCGYRCNFCAHSCFLKLRAHSAKYTYEMVNSVSEQCHVSSFIFQDSTIGNYRQEWLEFCNLLIKNKKNYKWWINLRVNQADEELLSLSKDAGCVKVFYGFESGSPRILEQMNKKTTVEQCRLTAALHHKLGLPFYASFIVNYPSETEEDLSLSEKLILETKPTSIAINKFAPIPGSVDFERVKGKLTPHLQTISDWSSLGMLQSPLLFGNMEEERFHYWFNHLRELRKVINYGKN